LLIAIIIVLAMLFARGNDGKPVVVPISSTSASSTPSASASESVEPPSEAPEENPPPDAEPSAQPAPPPAAGPTFATFTAPASANCTSDNPTSPITFSWSSANAATAWFGVHTENAKAAPYEEVPTTTTYTFDYQCSNDSEFYTVTLEDASGNLAHKTATITKN
jgi:hypothetical protein